MNKKITWAIQTELLDTRQMSAVWYAASQIDYCNVVSAIVKPFHEEIHVDEENICPERTIPYGSHRLCRLAKEKGWKFSFYDHDRFSYSLHNQMRDDMLNNDALHLKLSEVEPILKNYELTESVFLRPVHDNKKFNGGTLSIHQLYTWLHKLIDQTEYDDEIKNFLHTEVMMSTLKDIKLEYRFFIVGGRVIEGSTYKQYNKRVKHTEEVFKIAQEMANKWLPYDCVVMDIAELASGEFKVVEFNSINSSGFYDHNISSIVEALSEYALRN